jgi:hypothetical protein
MAGFFLKRGFLSSFQQHNHLFSLIITQIDPDLAKALHDSRILMRLMNEISPGSVDSSYAHKTIEISDQRALDNIHKFVQQARFDDWLFSNIEIH